MYECKCTLHLLDVALFLSYYDPELNANINDYMFQNLNNKNCFFEAGYDENLWLEFRVAVRFILNARLSFCFTYC